MAAAAAAAPARRSLVRGLLVLGVVFHAIYVLSIFDIYFTSPVVPHVESLAYASSSSSSSSSSVGVVPPAKRVVVFVADGCRADLFFERNTSRVSFLRGVVESRGSFGVSHTRVPTESRPGHVALFAGMYEDVSAVTKGWQDNPVDFDSVFNQSRHAWLFGSPDIVPMFARRVAQATELHYSHEEEDFASKDASQLDVWVHDRLRELLLVRARANATLDAELRAPQVVFFCHFLGIDTNGHAHRPQSRDYLANIALVDELVEKIARLFDDFYDDDGRTAFVFTADHGMSNKGAHGDGDPSNTRTPLVAWGAGIAGPERVDTEVKAKGDSDSDSAFQIDLPTQSRAQVTAQLAAQPEQEAVAAQQWGLAHLRRKDVMQADVAPLLSALLGLPYPRNSVGVLPFSFLARGAYRARAVVSNARQLQLHARRKEQEKEARTLLHFRAFEPFRRALPALLGEMDALLARGALDEAERIAQRVIAVCLDTLEYFQRYDWLFLFSTIVAGYLGWIGVLAVAYLAPWSVLESRGDFDALRDGLVRSAIARGPAFPLLAFSVAAYLALESSPWSYFVYVSFPLVFWNAVWAHRGLLQSALASSSSSSSEGKSSAARAWLLAAWVLGSLELVVAGYNHRWLFGVVFTLLALWPALEPPPTRALATRWAGACLLIAVFPFLPTEYGEHTALVVLGGLVVALVAFIAWRPADRASALAWLWMLPLGASLVAVHVTMSYLNGKAKPPAALTLLNWTLALAPIALAALSVALAKVPPPPPSAQLVRVALALAPSFVLLSISYEVLFFAALAALLLAWVELEDALDARTSVWQDLRRAFFFLVLVKIAFFGTGNVASMSSFEISSTYRFVTVFAPFLMGSLLVVKILIPFLLVACAFRLILARREAAGDVSAAAARAFLLVVAMSDVLALQFLFLVQNEGSWKQIGNSISMFGIVNAQIVFVPLLFLLAGGLVRAAPSAASSASRFKLA